MKRWKLSCVILLALVGAGLAADFVVKGTTYGKSTIVSVDDDGVTFQISSGTKFSKSFEEITQITLGGSGADERSYDMAEYVLSTGKLAQAYTAFDALSASSDEQIKKLSAGRMKQITRLQKEGFKPASAPSETSTKPAVCPACRGAGTVICPDCKETGLALCPVCGSQKHPGKLVCPKCNGNWQGQVCPRCDGKGSILVGRRIIACPKCVAGRINVCSCATSGTPGFVVCTNCGGSGRAGVCPTCGGTKKAPCPLCKGPTTKSAATKEPSSQPTAGALISDLLQLTSQKKLTNPRDDSASWNKMTALQQDEATKTYEKSRQEVTDKFAGKHVKWIMSVSDVSVYANEMGYCLKGDVMGVQVAADFPASAKDALAALRKGNSVTVVGTIKDIQVVPSSPPRPDKETPRVTLAESSIAGN